MRSLRGDHERRARGRRCNLFQGRIRPQNGSMRPKRVGLARRDTYPWGNSANGLAYNTLGILAVRSTCTVVPRAIARLVTGVDHGGHALEQAEAVW